MENMSMFGMLPVLSILTPMACGGMEEPDVVFSALSSEIVAGPDDTEKQFDIAIISESPIEEITFYVNGELDPKEISPPAGDCLAACTVGLTWSTAGLADGDYEFKVEVRDNQGNIGAAEISVRLLDQPVVLVISPSVEQNTAGHAGIEVDFTVTDRSLVDAEVFLDGALVANGSPQPFLPDCAAGCSMNFTLDTEPFDDGVYRLEVVATDALGNRGSHSVEIAIANILYISSIEFTNVKGFLEFFDLANPGFEIEAHLFDSNRRIGCSGAQSGLRLVDKNNTRYDRLVAYFQDINETSTPLTSKRLRDRTLQVRVIESDHRQQCPKGIQQIFDLPVGTSSPFAADLLPREPLEFEKVVHLQLEVGRPL